LGFRLGVIKTWGSRWYGGKNFGAFVVEDRIIRDFVKKRLKGAAIASVGIERFADKVKLSIHTAHPGIVIGKKGSEIEILKKDLEKLVEKHAKARQTTLSGTSGGARHQSPIPRRTIMIDIKEVKKPEVTAQLVAENVAQQLQKRIAFRRAMKKCMSLAFKYGALGVKIHCAGRLGGAEMARREWYREGRVPLHTLRADVDYGFAEAKTTYGIIGVKVHIFKGEIMSSDPSAAE
jgi:small subunit ribosomal protein S3